MTAPTKPEPVVTDFDPEARRQAVDLCAQRILRGIETIAQRAREQQARREKS